MDKSQRLIDLYLPPRRGIRSGIARRDDVPSRL